MNFCQYCQAPADYGYLCTVCREVVTCPKDNLCMACKKFIGERIARVEKEAVETTSRLPYWLRRVS